MPVAAKTFFAASEVRLPASLRAASCEELSANAYTPTPK